MLLPERILKLKSKIDENLENYSIEIHGIKGVLLNIGAYSLSDAAKELENLSKRGDYEKCKECHAAFESEINNFLRLAEGLLESARGEKQKAENGEALEAGLPRVIRFIKDFDGAAATAQLKNLCEVSYGEEIDTLLEGAQNAVKLFNFKGALELLTKIDEVLRI
jgi:HPt (histidine-containing phosphotransfer) domain-containing protein